MEFPLINLPLGSNKVKEAKKPAFDPLPSLWNLIHRELSVLVMVPGDELIELPQKRPTSGEVKLLPFRTLEIIIQ